MIVDAAYVEPYKKCYFLAASAAPLSFVSQQNRALNLVWALRETGSLKGGEHVAVVGGGIAGLTAACAMRAFGCRVKVYEARGRAMWRQGATGHRMVHPHLNFWPHVPCDTPTTNLPYLEWYFSTCEVAIREIQQQWDDIEKKSGKMLKLIPDRMVTQVLPPHTTDGDVRLECDPSIDERFDLAIVAVGFDDEKGSAGFASYDYWVEDHLERDKIGRKFKKLIVSGCGDGGMVDALRVAYDLNKGRLVVDLASKLTDQNVKMKVKQAEADSVAKAALYDEVVAQIKKKKSLRAIKAMIDGPKGPLDKRPRIVYLVDKMHEHPGAARAAPIHKLMIAYARNAGTIAFVKGSIKRQKRDRVYLVGTEKDRLPIDTTRVVIRHGAKLNLEKLKFLNPSQLQELESKNRQFAKYNHVPAYSQMPALADWPNFQIGSSSSAFAHSRRDLALRAMQVFDPDIRLRIESKSSFVCTSNKDIRKPDKLFGVKTKWRPSQPRLKVRANV